MNKIFGYTWEEISSAQQGKPLSRPIPPRTQYNPCSPSGVELLAEHGVTGLNSKEEADKMKGYVILSRNTSGGWSGPVYMKKENNGFRLGECYFPSEATKITRGEYDRLKSDKRIPQKSEFITI